MMTFKIQIETNYGDLEEFFNSKQTKTKWWWWLLSIIYMDCRQWNVSIINFYLCLSHFFFGFWFVHLLKFFFSILFSGKQLLWFSPIQNKYPFIQLFEFFFPIPDTITIFFGVWLTIIIIIIIISWNMTRDIYFYLSIFGLLQSFFSLILVNHNKFCY